MHDRKQRIKMARGGRRSNENFHMILSLLIFAAAQLGRECVIAVRLVARVEKRLRDRRYASTSERRETVTAAMQEMVFGARKKEASPGFDAIRAQT
jgi:hypothetical protein